MLEGSPSQTDARFDLIGSDRSITFSAARNDLERSRVGSTSQRRKRERFFIKIQARSASECASLYKYMSEAQSSAYILKKKRRTRLRFGLVFPFSDLLKHALTAPRRSGGGLYPERTSVGDRIIDARAGAIDSLEDRTILSRSNRINHLGRSSNDPDFIRSIVRDLAAGVSSERINPC